MLRFVVAYWTLLALSSVFVASALLVTFLWGPDGLSDAIHLYWEVEMSEILGREVADRYADRSSARMVGAFRGLQYATTMPLVVLNVAWLVWGGLILLRRRP